MIPRPLSEVGHDTVSITICVHRDDPDLEELRCYITERNTTLYDGKPWNSCRTVPLQYARIGQNFWMNLFLEHVMYYAEQEF